MSKVTEKILNTIKTKKIAPKPRWQFLLKQYLIWAMAVLSVIIGSFTFSVLIFKFVNNDWDVLRFLNRTPLQHLFSTLPYVWLILLTLFIGLAYYNARHTKGAYKYKAYWIVVGSFVISIALGGIFYAFGLGPRVHLLTRNLPFFQSLMHDRARIWLEAENGLLAGEVTEMLSGAGMFELTDFNDVVWVVRPGENYIQPPHFEIEPGVLIRMMGEPVNEGLFEAEMIMPYHMGPGFLPGGKIPGDKYRNGNHKLFFGR